MRRDIASHPTCHRDRLTRRLVALISLAAAGCDLEPTRPLPSDTHGVPVMSPTVLSGGGTITIPSGPGVEFRKDGGPWLPVFVCESAPRHAPPIPGTSYVGEAPGACIGDMPVGTTTYRVTFDLPDRASPSLTVKLHSDDQSTVYLNGHLIGQQATLCGPENYEDPPSEFSTSDPSFFRTGTNTLRIAVVNCGGPAVLDFEATVVVGRPILRVFGETGDIGPALTDLRTMLGSPLNGGDPGPLPVGRREINWDGVPAALTNVPTFPPDFFKNSRGAIFSTPGTGLQVSDNDFSDVNPSYGAQFNAFSPAKTFAPIGSNRLEVTFATPGTGTPAVTNGFGIVFSDVDKPLSTRIRYFDAAGQLIGTAYAPEATTPDGHSLAGIVFREAMVAKVVIIAGEAQIKTGARDISDGGRNDLVVMDDFLYGEPQ
jgi:hypothetical protein